MADEPITLEKVLARIERLQGEVQRLASRLDAAPADSTERKTLEESVKRLEKTIVAMQKKVSGEPDATERSEMEADQARLRAERDENDRSEAEKKKKEPDKTQLPTPAPKPEPQKAAGSDAKLKWPEGW